MILFAWETSIYNLNSILEDFRLTHIIDSPTKITNFSATFIDLLMVLNLESVIEKEFWKTVHLIIRLYMV